MADKVYLYRFGLSASRTYFLIVALNEHVSFDAFNYTFESKLLIQLFLFGEQTIIFQLKNANLVDPVAKLLVKLCISSLVEEAH